ncbi:MAG: hypothetical protein L3K26_15470 [Candidatus Hydrogenedentes bacterium]|nr:hypothetical protein [Candidatus Hydrogenedentota bacterium]
MDKILKFFKKLWLFKERLFLVILLGVLALNIYRIFVPPVPEIVKSPPMPEPPVVEDPPRLRLDVKGQYTGLVDRGPFSYYSDTDLDASGNVVKNAGVELLLIKQSASGRWRARLKTKSTKWWDEGDSFETFVLEKIDPVEQTVVVYVEKFAKSITLRVKE